jgi:hypothetical protein
MTENAHRQRKAATIRKLALVAGATETALKHDGLSNVRLEATNMANHNLVVTLTINEGLPWEQVFRVACADVEGGDFADYMLRYPLQALYREARGAQKHHKTGEPPDRCPLCRQGEAPVPSQIFDFMCDFLRRVESEQGRRAR